jgi:hypothetical protein
MMFVFGFLTCAVLDLLTFLLFRRQFVRVACMLDRGAR